MTASLSAIKTHVARVVNRQVVLDSLGHDLDLLGCSWRVFRCREFHLLRLSLEWHDLLSVAGRAGLPKTRSTAYDFRDNNSLAVTLRAFIRNDAGVSINQFSTGYPPVECLVERERNSPHFLTLPVQWHWPEIVVQLKLHQPLADWHQQVWPADRNDAIRNPDRLTWCLECFNAHFALAFSSQSLRCSKLHFPHSHAFSFVRYDLTQFRLHHSQSTVFR
jgi:hypothetical protein